MVARSTESDGVAGFFSEVPDRIEFGGLTSDDPLTYKVYEPDRLVLGR